MKTITVTDQPVNVNSGQVQLTREQAKPRLHNLKPVKVDKDGAGVYSVEQPIQFKRGEKFGYDGQVGKDGGLSDPDAELIAKLEAAEKAGKEAEVRIRRELQAKFDADLADAREQLEADLRVEIEARVRAELAGAKK